MAFRSAGGRSDAERMWRANRVGSYAGGDGERAADSERAADGERAGDSKRAADDNPGGGDGGGITAGDG